MDFKALINAALLKHLKLDEDATVDFREVDIEFNRSELYDGNVILEVNGAVFNEDGERKYVYFTVDKALTDVELALNGLFNEK